MSGVSFALCLDVEHDTARQTYPTAIKRREKKKVANEIKYKKRINKKLTFEHFSNFDVSTNASN